MNNFFKILISQLFVFIFLVGLADAKGLTVSLSTDKSVVETGKTLRVRINLNQPIKRFSPAAIGVDGGNVEAVRKLGSRTYQATIRAGDELKYLEVQIPADELEDMQGDHNEEASNMLTVKIDYSRKIAAEEAATNANRKIEEDARRRVQRERDDTTMSNLLNAVTAAQNRSNTIIQSQPNQVQYYNCNGQAIPTTQPCNNLNTTNNIYGNTNTPYIIPYTTTPYTYDMTYYDNYYNIYGYYPQSYYSSPYYTGVVEVDVRPSTILNYFGF